MRTVFILLDSVNRHYLNAYGCDWVKTPNIDRLAARGITFENHYVCSAPCMPARRDFMTGRPSFLEAPWGPLEPYDPNLCEELKKQSGVYCHLITDHYHYWERHASNYHCVFDTWEFIRGQEGDHWHPSVADPAIPPFRGKNRRQDWINRQHMDVEDESTYPTPKTFMKGIEFLEHNHEAEDWFLQLECFDPHEPFMAPKKYRDLYNDDWDGGYLYDWPEYKALDPEKDDPAAVEHIRKQYAATLTMADTWLGKFLDKMDELDLWDSTNVVFATDHGHLLGEHGYWAKNHMFDFNRLMQIPMIICSPTVEGGQRRSALTSAIDIMPTLLEFHGAKPPETVKGKSLIHLLRNDEEHHDAVLYGYFAKDIGMRHGPYTYCRRGLKGSITHHYTSMPVNAFRRFGMEQFQNAKMGKFFERSPMPLYRADVWTINYRDATPENKIFNLELDPEQASPIVDTELETKLVSRLCATLKQYDAPANQFERTGLTEKPDALTL